MEYKTATLVYADGTNLICEVVPDDNYNQGRHAIGLPLVLESKNGVMTFPKIAHPAPLVGIYWGGYSWEDFFGDET